MKHSLIPVNENLWTEANVNEKQRHAEFRKVLCKLPNETGWVEFKHNNDEPHMIGEDIGVLDTI